MKYKIFVFSFMTTTLHDVLDNKADINTTDRTLRILVLAIHFGDLKRWGQMIILLTPVLSG